MNQNEIIIFFDGKCNLCNGFIDFIIRWDKKDRFKVASLQGQTAKRLLPNELLENLNTVVLFDHGKLFIKTNAVLRIISSLHLVFRPVIIFLVIPSFIRDPIYNLVSKYRYSWFGKKETCRLPTEKEREYFLP